MIKRICSNFFTKILYFQICWRFTCKSFEKYNISEVWIFL